jgi:hypothetical protein
MTSKTRALMGANCHTLYHREEENSVIKFIKASDLSYCQYEVLTALINLKDSEIIEALAKSNLESTTMSIISRGIEKYPRQVPYFSSVISYLEDIGAPVHPFLNAIPSILNCWYTLPEITSSSPREKSLPSNNKTSLDTIRDFLKNVVMKNPITHDGRIVLIVDEDGIKSQPSGSGIFAYRVFGGGGWAITEQHREIAVPYDRLKVLNHWNGNSAFSLNIGSNERINDFYTTGLPIVDVDSLFDYYEPLPNHEPFVVRKPFDMESIAAYAETI